MPLKILFLTHRIPYPLTDGGAMVSDFMLTGFLDSNIEVSLISLNTSKHFVDVNILPKYYKQLQHFDTININNDITVSGAIQNLFTTESFHTARFKSEGLNRKIEILLGKQQFDLVILDNIFLQDAIGSIRKFSKAKIACRIHNIEHLIWQKLANNTKNIFKKKYLQLQTARLQKIELLTLRNVDLLLLLNKNEGEVIKEMNVATPQYVMPYGIDFDEAFNNTNNLIPDSCFHLASMNWMPNVEALDWFLDQVFPLVLQKNKNFIFHIGGKHLPEKYLKLNSSNILVYKEVKDAKQFMQSNGICIVPLLSGAGIRVKILEALHLGIPIISTTLGANGLEVLHQHDIIIANTPVEFANAILQRRQILLEIGKNAKNTAMFFYQKRKIIGDTIMFFNLFLNA